MEKKQIVIFTVLVTIAIVVFMILSPKKSDLPQDTNQKVSEKNIKKAKEKQRQLIEEYDKKQKERTARTKEPGGIDYQQQEKAQSETTKKNFLKNTYLNANLPDRFIYSEVDLDTDEPIKMIVGKHPHKNQYLRIGATTIVPEREEDIVTFINEYKNAFPYMDKSLISKLRLTTKLDNPRPGFKQLNIWEAHNSRTNKAEVIVYLPRSDGKGSYIFSYSGDSSTLEKNEDYIDELLESLKPQNAPPSIHNQ